MCAIYADSGELYSFGCNDERQLGSESSGSEDRVDLPAKITLPAEKTCIKMLSAGVYHSACLTGLMLSSQLMHNIDSVICVKQNIVSSVALTAC